MQDNFHIVSIDTKRKKKWTKRKRFFSFKYAYHYVWLMITYNPSNLFHFFTVIFFCYCLCTFAFKIWFLFLEQIENILQWHGFYVLDELMLQRSRNWLHFCVLKIHVTVGRISIFCFVWGSENISIFCVKQLISISMLCR